MAGNSLTPSKKSSAGSSSTAKATKRVSAKIPQKPTSFNVTLNDEQKKAKYLILNNSVVLLTGQAGSGKTLCAVHIALDLLLKDIIEKIVITRPVVPAGEDLGFLPGGIDEKMAPWVAPIFANLYSILSKEYIDYLVEANKIEIVPFAFMRGRTFVRSFIISDEAQNNTVSQTSMLLGRLGIDSKIVFCGDIAQTDLRKKVNSGIHVFEDMSKKVSEVACYHLLKNHRHHIVPAILEFFDEMEEQYQANKKKQYAETVSKKQDNSRNND